MNRLSIGMYLCFCLVQMEVWKAEGEKGSDISSCSCYSFYGNLSSQGVGQGLCKNNGGSLVSMETIEEWEFIKIQIQSRKTEPQGRNEWWIGLEKKHERWEWMSNHSLTYDKWLGEKQDENGKGVTIVKEFNGIQGLFNNTKDGARKGTICEYHKTNCSIDELRWCNTTLLTAIVNTTRGRNESGIVSPRHPSQCTVIQKQHTPVIIPIFVALVGLVVIIAVNIITIKWRNSAQESRILRKKTDETASHSEQVDMDPPEGTTTDMNASGSGIEQGKENLQPRKDCIGSSATKLDDGPNEIIGIDVSCGNTTKPEQPYYVNIQEGTQQNTLPDTNTNGHYALVSEVNETEGQNDSFVVVRTYSIVRNNDNNGQTDDLNTGNYATVSDTLRKDGQTVTLVTTESGYASVDVINNNSHHNEHNASTNAPNADGYAPAEVIYDNCRDVPFVQEQQGNIQHNLANNVPDAEYAVVNKSMKKRNRSVKETTQPSESTEASYASVDVENCQDGAPMQEQRGSRRKKDNQKNTLADSVPDAGTQVEYAAVNKSMKKRNRSVKETTQPSEPVEASYASVDVENCQDGAPVKEQRGSRRKKDNQKHTMADSVPDAGTQVEYAGVNKNMKKRNRSVKETTQPSEPVDVENCQDGAPVQEQRGSRRKKDNQKHTLADSVPDARTQVEYAAVNKSMKKRNRTVKETTQPSEPVEASFASVDVEYCQEDAPVRAQRRSRRKKDNQHHTQDESVPNAAITDKKKNRSVKEAAQLPSEATEASYASVDVIYANC